LIALQYLATGMTNSDGLCLKPGCSEEIKRTTVKLSHKHMKA
jgi:hypothetical protein